MIWFIVLSLLTTMYLIFAAVMDIREKKIYSFPAIALAFSWSIYLIVAGNYESAYLMPLWIIHILVITCLNAFKVWGVGDSDVSLLMVAALLVAFPLDDPALVVLAECLALIVALLVAFMTGLIEFKIRKMQINLHSRMALVPGFAFAIITCLIFELIRMVGI